VIYLDVDDLLYIAERVLGAPAEIRDAGLLEAAAVRPRASASGEDAYRDVHEKAAALPQSVVSNHALVHGNKRLGLAAVIAFYGLNGRRLTMTNDEAYDFIMPIAGGAVGTSRSSRKG
jgi:death on curing protein